jgi:2-phosphosulfolactate phosphatase
VVTRWRAAYRDVRVIDVAYTRASLLAADVVVVIDVLRATSTVAQALDGGYRRVVCVDSIERAAALRGPGRVLAGERHCVKPPGFDQGNSPIEAIDCRGEELVLATTNGAPTVVMAARRAPTVLLASLLNLDAVVTALLEISELGSLGLQIICSGTDGAVALEDVYGAGRLSALLPGPRTDAALAAEAVARSYGPPFEALARSADAAVLYAAGLWHDIAYCALESTIDVVPRVLAAGDGVAVVGVTDPAGLIPAALDAGDTVSA